MKNAQPIGPADSVLLRCASQNRTADLNRYASIVEDKYV